MNYLIAVAVSLVVGFIAGGLTYRNNSEKGDKLVEKAKKEAKELKAEVKDLKKKIKELKAKL